MLRALFRPSLFGLGFLVIVSSPPASAFNKVDLPGTRTKEYIKDICKGKGTYQEGQGQYGCMTNCGESSLASDACGINCSEKTNKCYGWTPKMNPPSPTPSDVLHPPKSGGK
jgi:hypothetical protein